MPKYCGTEILPQKSNVPRNSKPRTTSREMSDAGLRVAPVLWSKNSARQSTLPMQEKITETNKSYESYRWDWLSQRSLQPCLLPSFSSGPVLFTFNRISQRQRKRPNSTHHGEIVHDVGFFRGEIREQKQLKKRMGFVPSTLLQLVFVCLFVCLCFFVGGSPLDPRKVAKHTSDAEGK